MLRRGAAVSVVELVGEDVIVKRLCWWIEVEKLICRGKCWGSDCEGIREGWTRWVPQSVEIEEVSWAVVVSDCVVVWVRFCMRRGVSMSVFR